MRLNEPIFSRIAGVMMGDKELRQESLKILSQHKGAVPLELVPEPTNPYDSDAIAIFCQVPGKGRVHLGYVPNGKSSCTFCGEQFSRFPQDGMCPRCGNSDLLREGLAKKLHNWLRVDPTIVMKAEISEVTGGTQDKKSYGCNIKITPTSSESSEEIAEEIIE